MKKEMMPLIDGDGLVKPALLILLGRWEDAARTRMEITRFAEKPDPAGPLFTNGKYWYGILPVPA